jgi:DnaK suppressor protein
MSKQPAEGKDELQRMLIEMRDETVGKIEQEMGTKVDKDPRLSSLSTMDIGDLSQLDFDENIDYTLLQMHIERLREIEDALDRLADGSYGVCENCGEAIPSERLKVLPFTTFCVRCQEQQERMGAGSKLKQEKEGEKFEL